MATIAPEHKKALDELSVDDVRRNLAEVVNRAGYGAERIIITRNGKRLAAVVGLADLERLQASAA